VAETVPSWSFTKKVFHTLYLPKNWSNASKKWPLIVEFSGNGILPEDYNWTANGWGLSNGGQGFMWLNVPFVSAVRGNDTCNQRNWFGCDPAACDLYSHDSNKICSASRPAKNATNQTNDSFYNPLPTVEYAIAAVNSVIDRFGVDRERVLLTGHSRGALAVNFMGLHNDEIASLWSAFLPSSHYDGVREGWADPGSDNASALTRLKRIAGRPVYIVAECDLATTYAREYLQRTGIDLANFTIQGTGFGDHNSFWSLRPDPGHARDNLRKWLSRIFFSH
jgi:hypothetical protein